MYVDIAILVLFFVCTFIFFKLINVIIEKKNKNGSNKEGCNVVDLKTENKINKSNLKEIIDINTDENKINNDDKEDNYKDSQIYESLLIEKSNNDLIKEKNHNKSKKEKCNEINLKTVNEINKTSLEVVIEIENNEGINYKSDKNDKYIEIQEYDSLSIVELNNLAISMAKDGNWGKDAILVNRAIIKKDNSSSVAYTRLAKCYKDNDKIIAIKLYKEVLKFDPKNTIAINNIERLNSEINLSLEKNRQIKIDKYQFKINNYNINNESIDYEKLNDFVNERNIKSLFHFTQYENISNILNNGLLSVKDLEKEKILLRANDIKRLDNHKDSVSISISFPNYKYFYRLRCNNKDQKWLIIELKPSILWEKRCIFCATNAANSKVSFLSEKERQGVNSLEKLFQDTSLRNKLNLLDCFPTDPQAEVLVMDKIEPCYIKTIYYNDDNLFSKLNSNDFKKFNFKYNQDYFGPRMDWNYWSKCGGVTWQ